MWEEVFKRYWQVAILKEGPESTPHSPLLLIIVSFIFFLLIILQWYIVDVKQQFNLAISFLAGISLLCSYFIYTYVLLRIYHKASRSLQTLTALLVSHMIVHFFAFPLLIVTPILAGADMNQIIILVVAMVYLILTVVLTAWQFLVTIHIYKRALEADYLTAILASFGLLACNILTVTFWQ